MKIIRMNRLLAAAAAFVCLCFNANVTASLADEATSLGGNWMESPWFGTYHDDADSDWLYQGNWGWLYEVDGGDDCLWLYSVSENLWYWADGPYYPTIFRYDDAGWVWFWTDTIDPRLYYDFDADSWLASDGSDGEIWHSYYEAIVDAGTAEYDEISHDLVAVNDYNDDLPWNDAHTKICVVSWMPATYISSYVAGEDITPTWDIWVTVEGEAFNAGIESGLTGDALTLRMKQYLGLRPDKAYAYWVEFWVSPDALYRPSPDPEPDDSEAVLDFADSDEESVSESYVAWFTENEESDYVLARWGYPWTRLGYTYDWCDAAEDEVGFSEFVIRQGATVTVEGVYTNDEYFQIIE